MMLATSGGRPWRMPLDETWMAQWSRFFEIGRQRPNLSRRIGPSFSGGLFSGEVFGPIDETESVGLAYRDLLSSAFIPQWSVPALAAEIRAQRPALAELSPLLWDDRERERQIGDWLGRHRLANGLNDEDIGYLASDPPLAFYVLFEAAREMEGRRLGVLGSLILAETLYRALGVGQVQAPCAFADLARVVLGRPEVAPAIEACVPDIGTMAALIDYVTPSAPGAALPVPRVRASETGASMAAARQRRHSLSCSGAQPIASRARVTPLLRTRSRACCNRWSTIPSPIHRTSAPIARRSCERRRSFPACSS